MENVFIKRAGDGVSVLHHRLLQFSFQGSILGICCIQIILLLADLGEQQFGNLKKELAVAAKRKGTRVSPQKDKRVGIGSEYSFHPSKKLCYSNITVKKSFHLKSK